MSYLNSQQQVATKVQLDWVASTDIIDNLSIPATTWTDLGVSQTFNVDDPNSVIEIVVNGDIRIGNTNSNPTVGTRVVVDGTVTKQLGFNDALNLIAINALAGSAPVTITGLSAGTHTLKLQAYSTLAQAAYCQAATNAPAQFLNIRVLERKVLPSIFSGPQPTTKQQLDYVYTGADITAQAISANTWTDVIANQNFSVDDPNSIIEINVNGFVTVGTIAANAASRVIIDSAGTGITKAVGGGYCGSWINVLAGSSAITVTGLAAGTHTVKLQVFSTSAQSLYLRPSGQSGIENLQIRVLERKQTAALVSNCLVKLAEVSVGALGQANIQFSNIPQTYRHLRVEGQLRGDFAVTDVSLDAQFNGDVASNYDSQRLQAAGSSPGASEDLAGTHMDLGDIPGASSTIGRAAPMIWDIVNYTNTAFHKAGICRTFFITTTTSAANYIQLFGTNWRSTTAITSILLFPSSGNFVQGSVCSLYGVS